MKKFFRELFIYIFLTAVIALIISVMFYEDIPINKVIPSKTEYKLPEALQEELDKTLTEETPPEITYKVDSQRLDTYEDIDSYVPGKIDPFAAVSDPTTGGTTGDNNSSSGNSTSSGNGTGNGTTTDSSENK